MDNVKLKELIKESHNANVVGIIYGACATYGFSELNDVDDFLKGYNPDMVYLKSRISGVEVYVYAWELESFSVTDNAINIKRKNRDDVTIIF